VFQLVILQRSHKVKWAQDVQQFPKRVIEGIRDSFTPIGEAIFNLFLPALFGNLLECNYRCKLAELPVKSTNLALPNPTGTSDSCYKASTLMCSHLLEAFRGAAYFSFADHQSVRVSVTAERKSCRTELNPGTLDSILIEIDCKYCRTIQ
jgi:hypothetical protein